VVISINAKKYLEIQLANRFNKSNQNVLAKELKKCEAIKHKIIK
jgi:hypothetical protein